MVFAAFRAGVGETLRGVIGEHHAGWRRPPAPLGVFPLSRFSAATTPLLTHVSPELGRSPHVPCGPSGAVSDMVLFEVSSIRQDPDRNDISKVPEIDVPGPAGQGATAVALDKGCVSVPFAGRRALSERRTAETAV